ncbi:phosphate/phosphonate ABC transporter substrate-binding protein [Natrialba chahannaoensis JCM 10990]|uniref:Phosphate/phosphonate ABC transporter substrate-binding protein n=1 Tax=Natrialba chahannaoensis JCM 10990 TaxID=1227492 RepID=M0AUJ6_9EURY|nr:substrate-binding domain-containing protein [Natrialba chahannaoensis]ELZ02240.1 phosphate/phosphonate ABC transporter substrate-binding protein [Natrialba chahannaoensis JCM 10990]
MAQTPRCGDSTRRTFLKATGATSAAAMTGIAGCLGSTDHGIRFILNPAEEQTNIVEEYTPMKEYLEAETGEDIDLEPAGSYVETLEALETEQGELADTSPTGVPGGEGFADVVGVRTAFGGNQYFSTIVTLADSDINELSDLEGEVMTVGSALSVSGTLVPALMVNDAGLDIGDFPNDDAVDLELRNAGDHDTAREQLIDDDEIVAAATGAFASAPQIPQEQFDDYDDFVELSAEYDGAGEDIDDENPELQLIELSEPMLRAPIMARSNWDDPVRDDIEQALIDAEEEDLIPEDVDDDYELWFTGIQEADRDDYEVVYDVFDDLGLEFADFDE